MVAKLLLSFVLLSLAGAQDVDTDCSIVQTEQGRFVGFLQDNYFKVQTIAKCCEKCSVQMKPKCHTWHYNTRTNQCATFGERTRTNGAPNAEWIRYTPPVCECPAVLPAPGAPCPVDDGCGGPMCDDGSGNPCQFSQACNGSNGTVGSGTCACFDMNSLVDVMTSDGSKTVPISEIGVGDKVLAVNAKGNLVYEEVYYRGHYDEPDASTPYEMIKLTFGNESLSLTDWHILYASGKNLQTDDACIDVGAEKACAFTAEELSVGDKIYTVDKTTGEITGKDITKIDFVLGPIRNVVMKGGNIVVNGVIASNHLVHHNYKESVYLPMRILYWFFPSSSVMENYYVVSYWEDSLHSWVRRLPNNYDVVKYNSQNYLIPIIVNTFIVLVVTTLITRAVKSYKGLKN